MQSSHYTEMPSSPDRKYKTEVSDDFSYGTTVATSDASIRAGFLRKVYGILAAQLVLTSIIAGLMMFINPIANFMAGNLWVMIIGFVGSIGTLFALMLNKDKHPLNMQLLFTFTVFESLSIGMVCAAFKQAGIGYIVFEAFVLTATVFIGLTTYVSYTKKDFSFMGGFLYCALLVLLVASLFQALFSMAGKYSPAVSFVLSCGGAIIFCGYILYDTSMIMNHLSADEYIQATISLYLDVINLFMYLLQILAELQNRN